MEKNSHEFFSYPPLPPPPPGVPPEKEAGTPCRNFFCQEEFFYVCYLNLHVTFTLLHCMTLAHELQLR